MIHNMEEIDKIRATVKIVSMKLSDIDKDLMKLNHLISLIPVREDSESLDEIWKNMMEQKGQLRVKLDEIEKKYKKKENMEVPTKKYDSCTICGMDSDCGYVNQEDGLCQACRSIITVMRR